MTTLKNTIKYSDGVSKTDATGVVFYKNQLPLTKDNNFPVPCGEGAWSCAGGVNITLTGLLRFTQGNGVATHSALSVIDGNSYDFHIETQNAGGGASTLSFALGGGTPVAINPEVGFVYDIVLVAGAGKDLVVSGPNGVVEVTMIRGYEVLAADNEAATGTVLSLGQPPTADFIAFDTTWLIDPVSGSRIFYSYDGQGNIASLNNGELLGEQSIEIINCADLIEGYTPSIYAGTKSSNDSELLASGVTKVQVSGAVGSGTVALSVDGVALLPVFDTATDTAVFWTVSGLSVSWVMTGVTSFDLGQGV